MIENAIGKKAIKNYLPIQTGDVPATWADIDHTRDVLSWSPKTRIEDGQKYHGLVPRLYKRSPSQNLICHVQSLSSDSDMSDSLLLIILLVLVTMLLVSKYHRKNFLNCVLVSI
jgi:hypothetical protein